MNNTALIYTCLSFSLFAWLTLSDIRSRKLSNIIILMLAILVGSYLPFSALNLMISFGCLLFGIVAFKYRLLGAGDSKLLSVCLYAAQHNWLTLLTMTALVGGIMSVIALIYNYLIIQKILSGTKIVTLPYAVAIIVAAVTVIPYMEIS